MTDYTAHATSVAGRNGHTSTADGKFKFDLSMPKELGGEGKDGATNPEQLFAMGYAACFGSAVAAVAREQKKTVGEITVDSHVTLRKGDDGFKLAVELDVAIASTPKPEIEELIKAAHQMCPYSKAISGNVDVTLKAKG